MPRRRSEIQFSTTTESAPSLLVFCRSLQIHVRHCIEVWRFYRIRRSLLQLRERLLHRWCIYRGAFRSFRGHIQIQAAIGQAKADFGPATLIEQSGHRVPNHRTIARSLYTEMLRATHPWVDMTDVRIFLMGFDAGEQWSCEDCSNLDSIQKKRQNEASWFSSAERQVRTALQEINAARGHISVAIPAAIAGVTRKDECTRTKL